MLDSDAVLDSDAEAATKPIAESKAKDDVALDDDASLSSQEPEEPCATHAVRFASPATATPSTPRPGIFSCIVMRFFSPFSSCYENESSPSSRGSNGDVSLGGADENAPKEEEEGPPAASLAMQLTATEEAFATFWQSILQPKIQCQPVRLKRMLFGVGQSCPNVYSKRPW